MPLAQAFFPMTFDQIAWNAYRSSLESSFLNVNELCKIYIKQMYGFSGWVQDRAKSFH